MSATLFPEKPTCHDSKTASVFKFENMAKVWRDPETVREDGGQGRPYRACSYCGSIHPEDLMKFIAGGATLHGADWKYGWPHKFYVEGIPNPIVGQRIQCGGRYSMDKDGNKLFEPDYMEASATVHGKWYNEHLLDAGYDPNLLSQFIDIIHKQTAVKFSTVGDILRYACT